ncbi:hypothetical protein R5W23_000124 [Gemmata sp. JC673]|uniref:Uncharacterized protein n=1 Tax=Gemmata algarum TaxID=2975278 RepID=A0ABU5ESZ2_9BACT|nr:hypothetical protein [Gemmata algarum]MDY3557597.1 hypothetical protein [Gemmata algarum]
MSTMSKMDAVRAALRANPDLTASTGVPLLAKEYGVEISPNNFSTYKQVVKKEWSEGKSPAPQTSTPARAASPAPPKAAPQTSEPGGSSILAVVRTLKSLLATHSADELKDLIDALSE